MVNPEDLLSYLTGPSDEEIPDAPVVALVWALCHLPLRAPTGYKTWDSDEEEMTFNDLQPGTLDPAEGEHADQLWSWCMTHLKVQLPAEAGKLSTTDLKSTRASAVESGTLERLCGFWRAHQTVGDLEGHVFNFDIVELMVCILGLGDIPRNEFKLLAIPYLADIDEEDLNAEEPPQLLYLMRLLLRHDAAAVVEHMDLPKDLDGLKAIISGSASLLTVYLGLNVAHLIDEHLRKLEDRPMHVAYKERTFKPYAQ
ncbi:hypothetical protein WJX84_010683, partial [Apatococcus fuscideae]